MESSKLLVRAVHAYAPQNNDELKLAKGDIITVAQKDEGGWWEGTLDGKTGWFPSNYVVEVSDDEVKPETVSTARSSNSDPESARRAEYKQLVLDDFIQSENSHILELQGLWEHYLEPLRVANILTPTDYDTLIGNILELVRFHASMLHQVTADRSKPTKDQRVGKIFLDSARRLEALHKTYCSTHPKAVAIIEKYKAELDRFMESKGARSPGILVLIVGLSQPFRRLEKYPIMLQEMERHVEESNFDKGNLQRAIEYYKLIDKRCSETRKQKEMELDIVNGEIKGWEGSDVNTLGAIQYINLVHVGAEQEPRYFVLFENTLIFLRHFTESNSLVYEGRLPVSGITLTDMNDTDEIANAFEIAGPMLEPIFVQCSSKDAKDSWITLLSNILKQNRLPSHGMSSQQSIGQLNPPVQAWNIACLHPSPPINPFLNMQQQNRTKGPSISSSKFDKGSASSLSSRSTLLNGDSRHCSSIPAVRNEDDLQVLRIVDAFCPKRTVISNLSARSSLPQSQPSVSPKVIAGEKSPRNLIDIVMLLSDEMRSLRSAMGKINQQLEEETKSRKQLQHVLESTARSCKCSSCQ